MNAIPFTLYPERGTKRARDFYEDMLGLRRNAQTERGADQVGAALDTRVPNGGRPGSGRERHHAPPSYAGMATLHRHLDMILP